MSDNDAQTITVSRSNTSGAIAAERATIEQSNVRSLETRSALFDRSNVINLKAEDVVINQGAASFVRANQVRLVKSNALVVSGDTNAVEGDLKTVFFSGNATGNVHMIFDRQSALRFGAGLGVSFVALWVIVRKIFK